MALSQLTGSETMASHSSYHNEERTQINTNITNTATNASGISTINTKLSDAIQTDFEKLHDITASAAELNVIDGVTASTAEINVLDGIPATLTATELGYVDGVTSSIQTQLNKIRTATKTSDQTVNNSATLVDITDLSFSVEANSKYLIDFILIHHSNSTANIKYGWSYPSGASMKWGTSEVATISDSLVNETYDADEYDYIISAFLQTTDAGTMQLKFAQATANASDTKVLAGSVLIIYKLS